MQAPSPVRCAQCEAAAPTSLPRLQDPLRTGREGTTMSQPIFFGYRTALELCRTPGFPAAAQSNASFRSIPGRAPAKGELREALDCLCALLPAFASERPLDCLVGSRSHPHDPGPFQFHACLHRPPTNAFIRLDDLIYVAAPPYAFIQESSRSGLVELYQMEYEICGSVLPHAVRPGNALQHPAARNGSIPTEVRSAQRGNQRSASRMQSPQIRCGWISLPAGNADGAQPRPADRPRR